MPTAHRVAQGEHLVGIALNYGFADWRAIWDHERNKELREQRTSPTVLLPGDVIYIPDKEAKETTGSTEARHTFKMQQRETKLRLRIEDASARPLSSGKCEVKLGAHTETLTIAHDGFIEMIVPPYAQEGTLTVRDSGTTLDGLEMPLLLGHLDPVSEVSGQAARLNNLGYRAGDPTDASDYLFRSAIEEFQCDLGLVVDGRCGPKTQAKLVEVHGS